MRNISRTVLRRTTMGISAAALALGATLALAPAANALPSTGVIDVFKVGSSEVDVAGTNSDEDVTVSVLNKKLTVTRNSGPSIVAGAGCTKAGPNVVECTGTIKTIRIDLFGGKDKAENSTNIVSGLFGGQGDDILIGGTGTDKLNGGPGSDTCRKGETVLNCEKP